MDDVEQPNPSISSLIEGVEGYMPTIPEQLTKYYSECNGLSIRDDNVAKLLSLAVDKVLVDILHNAQQRSLMRKQVSKSGSNKEDETLELEDLEGALAEMRIFVRRKKQKVLK